MSKNRILVIEDDKDIADSIGLNLELSGYDYTIIDDGLEAAKRLSASQKCAKAHGDSRTGHQKIPDRNGDRAPGNGGK